MKTFGILFAFYILATCFCSESEDYPMLLLGNRANIQLIQAQRPNNTIMIMDEIDYIMSCDYIYSDNLIFWMDAATGQEKIQSTFTNVTMNKRTKHNTITTGLAKPDGLACDWIGKKLYWTDAQTNHIEVSELDGSIRTVLIWDDLDQPRAIAVDPLNGYMYWSDWGENAKIERAGMDGSNRKALVERDGIYWPNGLTIDYEEGKIYWVDANYHYINRMNPDGSGREVVVSQGPSKSGDNNGNFGAGSSLKHPFAITLSGNRIYWTDWATNSIYSAIKNGSGQSVVVKANITSLYDIRSYGAHRQKIGRNPCGRNNGGCSHLCLISPKPPKYSCACPTGVLLNPDGKTCRKGPESILLLARQKDVRVISLDTPDFTNIVLPLENRDAVAIEYDPVDDMVYWSNNVKTAIYRAYLNGSNEEKILSEEIERCDGIAIDWVARNIYWAETGRNYIAVARLNGTSRRILIEEGVDNPRAIALDPGRGQLYWSDWGEPKIERASLDGSDRYIFVNTSIQWANGLAIDYERRLLYWAEAYLDKIEVIGLNGSGRRVLLEEKIPHIFGFSFLDDYLYWSDWEKRKVERMLVSDKHSRHSIVKELPDLMGIKASRVDPIPITNPCAKNNGGCSHLCLFTPKGVRCQCPNGQELLSDLKNCIEPEAFLLFTLSAEGVRRISLDTGSVGSVQVPFEKRVDAVHVDVSVEEDSIFWTDNDEKKIFRAKMDGTNVTCIVDQGESLFEGVAIDWLGRNIYWADSLTHRIEMARLDGSSRRPVVLQGVDSPLSVAVDPINGYIYWSEWGGQPKIRRAEMDGSHVTTLLGQGNIGRANSLTIDHEQKRLYWVDLDALEIYSSNMTGGDVKTVISSRDRSIFSMTLYDDYIFWTKENSIERANKTTGGDRKYIQEGMTGETIQDMLVYHTSRQAGVSACSHLNGGCEHICLSVPGGTHKCACPAHYKLRKDNVTCAAPENFVLFAQRKYIQRVVPGRQSPDVVLNIPKLENVTAIDYDPVDNFVYWIDSTLGEIRRSRMNGTEMKIILPRNRNISNPYDLAVDPFGRMLYWTDSRNNSISVMRLDGMVMGNVLTSPAHTFSDKKQIKLIPRKIAVNPKNGELFFSSQCPEDSDSCRTSIVRTRLDGSELVILFSKGLTNVTGLAVDPDAKKLYWSNSGKDGAKIESSDVNGEQRSTFNSDLNHPGSIAVYGNTLYWIDCSISESMSCQIEAGRKSGHSKGIKGSKVIKGMVDDLQDIVGVTSITKREFAQHPCTTKNGRCSHICMASDDGSIMCACPTHLTKIEDTNCVAAATCKVTDFKCASGGSLPCIPGAWRCDRSADCKDESDELNCPPCLSEDSFQCGAGMDDTEREAARAAAGVSELLGGISEHADQCVPMSMRCDGHKDCLDDSDEHNCGCSSDEFQCSNKKCIPENFRCDNIDHCGDNSDEDCGDAVATDQRQHLTWIIIVVVICCAVVVLGVVITFKRRKKSYKNSGSVTYHTTGGTGGIQVNFEVHHDLGYHPGSGTHSIKPPKRGNGGQSTASVNVSIGHRPPEGPTHIIDSHLPQLPNHPAISAPHLQHGVIPYPGSYSERSLQPQFPTRPRIPGASSSSSSVRTKKHYIMPLNPPPSPVTTDRSGSKSAGECPYSSDSQSARTTSHCNCRRSHRHSRRMYHPHPYMAGPHPTPCPSDSYDDCNSYHSGASGTDFDTISRRSKSGGAPSSPPPPYCHCCHHVCNPYMYNNGGYHPYMPPAPYSSSHHGYRAPPLGHDHHHSSSSSGSTHIAPHECSDCWHRPVGRHHRVHSRKGSRGLFHRIPQRYHPAGYDLNSDSDMCAPPPTPRSQCLSDYYCTHDEAEDVQDEDPTRFINRLEGEEESSKETDRLVQAEPQTDTASNKTLTAKSCLKKTPAQKEENLSTSKEEKSNEVSPLLSSEPSRSSSSNTELSYPIFDPPPSPATDSS